MTEPDTPPLLLPLGDSGLLVRFGTSLSEAANRRAVAFARRLRAQLPAGVVEIDPNLVSVLLRYEPRHIDFERLAGEVRLLLAAPPAGDGPEPRRWTIPVRFGGAAGPDLAEVAAALSLGEDEFISRHNALPLRVLTTGFAPGFVYCGFHPQRLRLPRRPAVRPPVPAGSVLFAAGQTAIAATPIPTGWHVIGITDFRNFDPAADPPTQLREGDFVSFEKAL
ncbi:MAG TPA: allophanate hydrolase subunit 1 [Devosia sp.]|nr:allophanate hydrolase subunit 1 [Devosia sp.]